MAVYGMANYLPWYLERGQGPVVATAIHDGHEVREDVLEHMAISETDRLREEDPFTGEWTDLAPTRIIGLRSRFEVDLNRPREKAVYLTPADAWGLRIWNDTPPPDFLERSLAVYDAFYEEVGRLLRRMVDRYGRVVVLDLHTYNHRRQGPDGPPGEPRENPDINLGTGTMDRRRWAPVVDRFIVDLRNHDFMGRHLDVRENVKFRGGQFPAWIHREFPETVCVLAVEVKKFFMDEWNGQPDIAQKAAVLKALKSTVWGIHEELLRLEGADPGVLA